MIARLTGVLAECGPAAALLDVGGVGYRVQIPLSTFYRLTSSLGSTASLHVHTHVREDALSLFGFATADELAVFERLIGVSGVGPKLALAVLSGIGVDDFARALAESDRAKLERIPGVGRKTAERILLELRETSDGRRRARRTASPAPGPPGVIAMVGVRSDAVSALQNLGYVRESAERAVETAWRDAGPDPGLEAVLRAALRGLVK